MTLGIEVDDGENSGATALTFNGSKKGEDLTADFSNFSGVDFSSLDTLSLTLSSADTGVDMLITGGISAVPVPAALPLLGAGMIGFAVAARRKKAQAAA